MKSYLIGREISMRDKSEGDKGKKGGKRSASLSRCDGFCK
jgi:hypothetical protein